MKKKSMLHFLFLLVLGSNAVSAQITITIPGFPKIKKPKIEQPTTEQATTGAAYDKQEFTNITWGNTMYIDPYLECYAKKHNLELIKVTDHAFSPRRFENAAEMKRTLQAELSKLAEIESLLKSKLRARPDTSRSYHENPAIWEEITSNRDEYLQCALGAKESLRVSESVWLKAHLESIGKMQRELDEYDPEIKAYPVSASSYDYLLFAVSPRERAKWLTGAKALEFKPNIDPALDALSASAAKKLPLYKANPAKYNVRNPIEERMMKTALDSSAGLKVYKIGLNQANWLISKDDYNLPTSRYKHGMIWARDPGADHPYCYFYYVNIIQDYAGGGRYGASRAKYLNRELAGCPAAQ